MVSVCFFLFNFFVFAEYNWVSRISGLRSFEKTSGICMLPASFKSDCLHVIVYGGFTLTGFKRPSCVVIPRCNISIAAIGNLENVPYFFEL